MFLRNQFWLYACVVAGAAFAHEPFESTATARLQHGRLEVILTLSPHMAAALVSTGEVETEPTAAFDSYRARLQAMAPDFLNVTGGGQPLAAPRIAVRRNTSAEPEIVYLFNAPPPGPLRFEAAYLRRLPPSYFGHLSVLDDDENPLGRALLVTPEPIAEFRMPPSFDKPATASVASPRKRKLPVWPAWLAVAIVVVGAGALIFRWSRSRKRDPGR